MKKWLIPITVLLIVVAWWNFIYDAWSIPKEYNQTVTQGDAASEKDLYFEAANKYEEAKQIQSSFELDLKILDTYEKLNENESYILQINMMLENYPDEIVLYEKLAKKYQETDEIAELVAFLLSNEDVVAKSKVLQEIYLETEKRYDYSQGDVGEVKLFRGEMAAVLYPDIPIEEENEEGIENPEKVVEDMKYEDLWALVGPDYHEILQQYYSDIQISEDMTVCFVKDRKQKWTAINSAGYLVAKNDEKRFEHLGPLSSIGIAVGIVDGKCCFVNSEMKVAEVPFDYASNFSEGLAAVKKGGKWAIVDAENWSSVTDYPYEEVALNLEECCVCSGVLAVKINGKYYLLNEKGEKISENAYDELKAFESDQPTGYKKGNKWGFLNKYGEVYIEAQYEDVMPFTNGYAAVKKDGLWGYINKDNAIVIEPQFKEALPVFSTGVGFVKGETNTWGYISLDMLRFAAEIEG